MAPQNAFHNLTQQIYTTSQHNKFTQQVNTTNFTNHKFHKLQIYKMARQNAYTTLHTKVTKCFHNLTEHIHKLLSQNAFTNLHFTKWLHKMLP